MVDKKVYETVEAYIQAYPNDVQEKLREMQSVIRSEAPEATEKISYGMPTFFMRGNLVHFAAFAKHIGFYPTPSAIEAFKTELAGYKHAKGSVQFPMNEPLPTSLIAKMVAFRVHEIEKLKKK